MAKDTHTVAMQPVDRLAINFLRKATGIHNTSEAIRFAIHEAARARGFAPDQDEDEDEATGTDG